MQPFGRIGFAHAACRLAFEFEVSGLWEPCGRELHAMSPVHEADARMSILSAHFRHAVRVEDLVGNRCRGRLTRVLEVDANALRLHCDHHRYSYHPHRAIHHLRNADWGLARMGRMQ